jgi:Flp pilus assembly pilin Flp
MFWSTTFEETTMLSTVNEKSLELAVHTQIALTDLASRMRDRLSEEEGQTAAEYIGIILVIAAVIAVVSKTGIATAIGTGIENAIKKVSE